MRIIFSFFIISLFFLAGFALGDNPKYITDSYLSEFDFSENQCNEKVDLFEKVEGPVHAVLKPNYTGCGKTFNIGTEISINSDGIRNKEISHEKPNNTVRVLILGDSNTFGWGLRKQETFPYLVEKRLDKRNPSQNIQVVNAGIPAYGMKDYRDYLINKGLSYEPDIVIIGINNNDYFSSKQYYNFLKKARTKISKLKSEKEKKLSNKQINRLIKEDIQRSKQKELEYHDLINPKTKEYMNQILKNSRAAGIDLVFYSTTSLNPKDKKNFRSWASKTNAIVEFAPENINEHVISKTDTHPNPKAHRLLAEKLFNTTKKHGLNET